MSSQPFGLCPGVFQKKVRRILVSGAVALSLAAWVGQAPALGQSTNQQQQQQEQERQRKEQEAERQRQQQEQQDRQRQMQEQQERQRQIQQQQEPQRQQQQQQQYRQQQQPTQQQQYRQQTQQQVQQQSHQQSSTNGAGTPNNTKTYTPRSNATSGATHTLTPGTENSGAATKTYTPGSSTTGPGIHTYTPGNSVPTASTHSYTPGNSTTGSTTSSGPTHTYTPGSPSTNSAGKSYSPGAAPTKPSTGGHPAYTTPNANHVAATTANGDSVLSNSGSREVLQQVNASRAKMSGLNRQKLPTGDVTVHANGSLSLAAADGRKYGLRTDGSLATYAGHGHSASFLPNGRLASVHAGNMDIRHNPRSGRMVVVRRPDHSIVVVTGRDAGYVQRRVTVRGHEFVQRTYLMGGRTYLRTYSVYTYHGVQLLHYRPAVYYAPEFYGWAYYPWAAPAAYQFAWVGTPWYGFYGPYFTAWGTYSGASAWLTDYYLGQMLQEAYQARMDAQQDVGGADADTSADYASSDPEADPGVGTDLAAQETTPITPELKQAIADEVTQQLALKNADAEHPDQTTSDLPQLLNPPQVFVVDAAMDVQTPDQQTCGLSMGDVLRLTATPDETSPTADLTVASSRRADCPAGTQVTLSLEILQEFQNSFAARLDSGLQTLRASQGRNGLPSAPQSAIAPPPRPVPDQPTADAQATVEIQSVQKQADQTETSTVQEAFAAGSGNGAQ